MASVLLVTIDTEEEFDWAAPLSSDNRSVQHVAELHRLQDLFEELAVRPTYVVDYPIATTEKSVNVLRGFLERKNCEIGAHLHPWVNPPIEESITSHNSFLCNLPLALQQAKIETLTRAIETSFDQKLTCFKAGRYGLDFRLVPFLSELGYCADSSVLPYHDWSSLEGPNFVRFGSRPFWLPASETGNHHEPMLEIPTTVGFNRRPFWLSSYLRRFLSRRPFTLARLVGIMWRTGFLRRIILTPEGTRSEDQLTLLKTLRNERDVVLNLELHSPSIQHGNTPFVRTKDDLDRFFANLRTTLKFAVCEMGARCMTMSEFAGTVEDQSNAAQSLPNWAAIHSAEESS